MIPAIMFTTGPGDEVIQVSAPVESVSAITITDIDGATATQVARGAVYQLDAEAVSDGNNDTVRWSLSGNTSLHTSVSQTGVLKVGTAEASNTFKVRATATYIDPDNPMQDAKYTERTLTVIGTAFPMWPVGAPVSGITVKGVEVSPTFDPAVTTYTVAVEGGTATKSDVVVSGPDKGDVKIGIAGDTITIHAYSAPGDPVYTVTVTAAP